MPLGYDMLTIQHTISGEIQEIYASAAAEYLVHPWFSQFYIIYVPLGYGIGAFGSGPYGDE